MSFFDRTLKYSSKKGHIKYNTKKMTENLFDPQNIRKMIIFFNKKMINKFFEQKEDEITVDHGIYNLKN